MFSLRLLHFSAFKSYFHNPLCAFSSLNLIWIFSFLLGAARFVWSEPLGLGGPPPPIRAGVDGVVQWGRHVGELRGLAGAKA